MTKTTVVGAVVVTLLLACVESEAAVRRVCKVSYETQDGWSQDQRMEVMFATGVELNESTHSFRYSVFSSYALLWFDKGEVAVLKLRDFFIRDGDSFTAADFRNLYMIKSYASFLQVNSPSERSWRIKAKEFISFIDPRAE